MTPLAPSSSSSAGESSMDNTSNTTITTDTDATHKHKLKQPPTLSNKRKNSNPEEEEQEQEQKDEEGDAEVWQSFNSSFRQVQSVLDRNRVLIQQVNENHQSKIADNMVKNVALIQEINGNISKVVSLYSDLSTNFTSAFHQRNKSDDGGSDREKA